VLDATTFALEQLLPRLVIHKKARTVAVHPVCSMQKLGQSARLEALARACSESVVVPFHAGCCGLRGAIAASCSRADGGRDRARGGDLRGLELDGCYATAGLRDRPGARDGPALAVDPAPRERGHENRT
jgi:D-lactate dehydrogenase